MPETLTGAQFAELTAAARTIHRDRRGAQVLLTANDRIVKLFHRRGRLSSDLIRPYARRFIDNAARLQRLGVTTVEVEQHLRCRQPRLDLVVYPRLAGEPVRELAATRGEYQRALQAMPRFIAELHQLGIYFKGLHLGNLLYRPPDRFSLIDIVNVHFSPNPLVITKRVSNLHHLFCRNEDFGNLRDYGLETLLNEYLTIAELDTRNQIRLLQRLRRRSTVRPELAVACQRLLTG